MGKPFCDLDDDWALLESLIEHLVPKISMREVDAIIDDDFTKTVAEMLELAILGTN